MGKSHKGLGPVSREFGLVVMFVEANNCRTKTTREQDRCRDAFSHKFFRQLYGGLRQKFSFSCLGNSQLNFPFTVCSGGRNSLSTKPSMS